MEKPPRALRPPPISALRRRRTCSSFSQGNAARAWRASSRKGRQRIGFLTTHWSGTYAGHSIEAVRTTGGHHFELVIDGKVVDSETSWINMGRRHLEGMLHHEGRQFAVKVDRHDVAMNKVQ
jgi:hypothetical protein